MSRGRRVVELLKRHLAAGQASTDPRPCCRRAVGCAHIAELRLHPTGALLLMRHQPE